MLGLEGFFVRRGCDFLAGFLSQKFRDYLHGRLQERRLGLWVVHEDDVELLFQGSLVVKHLHS